MNEEFLQAMELAKILGIPLKSIRHSVPDDSKVIKATVTCSLCGTRTVQYIKLIHFADGVWQKEKDLEEGEVEEKCQLYTATVRSCWACESMLLQKEKEELVSMILKKYAPVPSQRDILRMLKDLNDTPVLRGTDFQ